VLALQYRVAHGHGEVEWKHGSGRARWHPCHYRLCHRQLRGGDELLLRVRRGDHGEQQQPTRGPQRQGRLPDAQVSVMWVRALRVGATLTAGVAGIGVWPAPAFAADPEPQPSAAAQAEERLRQAKALFQEGNLLRKAGDIEGALEFFLRSRNLVPS